MFVLSRRNIILPGPNGEKFHMPRDYMGPVPAWAEDSAYLKALEEDGKVVITAAGKDKEFDAAGKRRGRKKPAGASKPEDIPGEPPEEAGSPDPEEDGAPEES